MRKISIIIIFSGVLLIPVVGWAATLLPYNLEVPIGSVDQVGALKDYINVIYKFFISLIGILATVMIMYGGFKWVLAAGNESIIGQAKETITSAIIGLCLALLSYLILFTINPALVELRNVEIEEIVPPSECTNEELGKRTAKQSCTKDCECGSVIKNADGINQNMACLDSKYGYKICSIAGGEECAWKRVAKNSGAETPAYTQSAAGDCAFGYTCGSVESGVLPVNDATTGGLEYYVLKWECVKKGEHDYDSKVYSTEDNGKTIYYCPHPNIYYQLTCYANSKDFVTSADREHD